MTGINPTAAGGFGAGAEIYERARPSYPADVMAAIVGRLGIGPGRRVLDLAAGTGKMTRLLVPTGASVVAVEPVAAMRDQLTGVIGGDAAPDPVEVLDGTAEAVPLPDASVDAVVVAQAFHWFDTAAALAEIGRVLRPGGGLGLVWNWRDTSVGWVADLEARIGWDQRGRWSVPYATEEDWGARLQSVADAPFGRVQRYEGALAQVMTPDLLVDRVLSTSYLADQPAEVQAKLADELRSLVAPLGGRFELPYRTHLYWCHRNPA